MNKVILIGNVGKDPEIRTVGESSVANYSLATSESYKNKDGERVSNTEWHNLSCWGHLAELSEKYIKKGNKIAVEGKIQTRSWEAENGEKKYLTEIRVMAIELLSSSSESEKPKEEEDDGLPF